MRSSGRTIRRKGGDTYFRDFMRLLRRRYGDGGDIRYCGPSVGQKENEIRFNKRSEDMCQFKSGIILKSKVVIAPSENDSHSDLLETLGIRDDYLNATKTFVRAELIPEGGEWWVSPEEHPEEWKFAVDQDITPDWFDPEEYEKAFREGVCAWWKDHVLVDKKIDELNSGFYRLKRCEVKKLCNDVKVLLDGSQVGEMWDSSQVGEMWDSSQVGEMRDGSQVGEMRDGSQVGEMRDSSQVGVMWGSSQVGEMLDGSQVGEMRDGSQVGEMWDSSQVGVMRDSSTARDFKNYPNVKIFIPENENFEMVVHKAEKE